MAEHFVPNHCQVLMHGEFAISSKSAGARNYEKKKDF